MSELWDIYDIEGCKTGRVNERGRELDPGDYHLAVHVWMYNGRGMWLIDKRSPGKDTICAKRGKWETVGGAVLAGEESLDAALREVREELGINLNKACGELFRRVTPSWGSCFCDVWVFEHDCPIDAALYDESEVCAAMWAPPLVIREMLQAEEFLGLDYYPYIDDLLTEYASRPFVDIKHKLCTPEIQELLAPSVFDSSPAGMRRKISRYAQNEAWELYGWMLCGEVAAVCGFEVHAEHVEILNIAVAIDKRQMGIGRCIVTALLAKYGLPIVVETDDSAIDFYRKLGFFAEPFQKHGVRRWDCVLEADVYNNS